MPVSAHRNNLFAGLFPAFLLVWGIGLFSHTFHYPFINWDDWAYIRDNPHIRGISAANIWGIFSHFTIGEWFPLQQISYAVDYSLWGLSVEGYHIENTIIHVINSYLVSRVIDRILGQFGFEGRKQAGIIAGALFLVHPMNVESFVWMSQRKMVLCLMFCLLSLLTYMSARERNSRGLLACALFLYILSLLSKINSLTLPPILFLWEWVSHPTAGMNGTRAWRGISLMTRHMAPLLSFLIVSIAATAVFVYGQISVNMINDFVGGTPYTSILNPLAGLVFKYANRLVLPFRLSAYYPHVNEYVTLWDWHALAGMPVWFAGILMLQRAYRAYPHAFFFGAWYCISNTPTSGVVSAPYGGADRHMYFPSIGILALFSMGIVILGRRYGRIPAICAGVIFLLLSAAAWERSTVWRDSTALWTDVVSKTPGIPYGQHKLAMLLRDSGDLKAAAIHARNALSMESGIALYHFTYAQILAEDSQFAAAVNEFRVADSLEPGNASLHIELGKTLVTMGDRNGAIREYTRAVALDPAGSFAALRNLAVLHIQGKEYKAARDLLEQSLLLNPESAEIHRFLGALYIKALGREQKGIYHLRRSLELDPRQPGAALIIQALEGKTHTGD